MPVCGVRARRRGAKPSSQPETAPGAAAWPGWHGCMRSSAPTLRVGWRRARVLRLAEARCRLVRVAEVMGDCLATARGCTRSVARHCPGAVRATRKPVSPVARCGCQRRKKGSRRSCWSNGRPCHPFYYRKPVEAALARHKRIFLYCGMGSQPSRPTRRAMATACVRLCAPSFMLMLRRWVRTVLSDT